MSVATIPSRSILDATVDPRVFGRWVGGPSWANWRARLAALFGLPLSEAHAEVYRRGTGRTALPTAPAREAWLIVGRRGGKSLIASVVAVWCACFRDWTPHLGPGERATVMLIAADRRQARVLLRYVGGLL